MAEIPDELLRETLNELCAYGITGTVRHKLAGIARLSEGAA